MAYIDLTCAKTAHHLTLKKHMFGTRFKNRAVSVIAMPCRRSADGSIPVPRVAGEILHTVSTLSLFANMVSRSKRRAGFYFLEACFWIAFSSTEASM